MTPLRVKQAMAQSGWGAPAWDAVFNIILYHDWTPSMPAQETKPYTTLTNGYIMLNTFNARYSENFFLNIDGFTIDSDFVNLYDTRTIFPVNKGSVVKGVAPDHNFVGSGSMQIYFIPCIN